MKLHFVLLFLLGGMLCLPWAQVRAGARSKPGFRYVAGSWEQKRSCRGDLQVGSSDLTFECKKGTFTIPYSSLSFMEYRPAPSNKVKGSRIHWRRRLPFTWGLKLPWIKRKNRYFSIVFSQQSGLGAAVFEVKPSIMRPYMAELDLRTGSRIEMESFEP